MKFREARACIIDTVRASSDPQPEEVDLSAAAWRVLAEDISADRDYPPANKSLRDGFAVRSADLPGSFEILGEVRAGETSEAKIGPGQTMEIMTGAPVPAGADQIVMVEHTSQDDDRMTTDRPPLAGEFLNPKGSEAAAGQTLLRAGRTIDYSAVSLLATVGKSRVRVWRKPRVAIIPTGDEVVEVSATPLPHQVRNSNAWSLAAQVARAGGIPEMLPVAGDNHESTSWLIEKGLKSDLLLLSGGVSAGKYDIVEPVLAEFGAEFYFDRTLIQPGRPTVFGRAQGTFFFGLPGNPISTMVTFKVFAQAAMELLGGHREMALPFFPARLTREFRHKTGLTRFLPAELSADGADVTPISWQGSSDVPAVARGNVFLVADPERESWRAGDSISVMPK